MNHKHPPGDSTQCEYCRNNLPFDFPNELLKAISKGEVVLFAGAGVSTESNTVPVRRLVEVVCSELGIDVDKALPFPDLMSQFCEKFGKDALLRKIKEHFDNIRSFFELYAYATKFHAELATIFLLEDIVTTNWDDYFERECGATPFVTAEDFAFWNLPGRKVLKIHGSINSIGSIVATREDYERCYRDLSTGLLGSSLKLFLGTKTILYMGFSFRDDDFLRIHEFLSQEMKGLRPRSFIVTLDRSSDERFRSLGVTPIYTDASFFLTESKKNLTPAGHMIADERFDALPSFYSKVLREHKKVSALDLRKEPAAWYCLAYQDGLKHALGRIATLRNTGYYSHSCNLGNTLKIYEKGRKANLRARNYLDVAYIDGYINGHFYLVAPAEGRQACPIFYVFGCAEELTTFDQFRKALRRARKFHRGAFLRAESLLKRYPPGAGIQLHHPPILDLGPEGARITD
jgi:hypothetical protein